MNPTDTSKATPRPWFSMAGKVGSVHGFYIADGPTGKWKDVVADELTQADAQLTVAAVNSYDRHLAIAEKSWELAHMTLAHADCPTCHPAAKELMRLLEGDE